MIAGVLAAHAKRPAARIPAVVVARIGALSHRRSKPVRGRVGSTGWHLHHTKPMPNGARRKWHMEIWAIRISISPFFPYAYSRSRNLENHVRPARPGRLRHRKVAVRGQPACDFQHHATQPDMAGIVFLEPVPLKAFGKRHHVPPRSTWNLSNEGNAHLEM
jgi:hypothetical protein